MSLSFAPLIKFESNIVNQEVDENCSLHIFEMTISNSKPPKELVNIKLLISSNIELISKT
jgi:hypothetical protein